MKQITGPNLAFLDGRFVNVPGDTMTGPLIITPTADGTSILRVNKANGTVVFNVDTSGMQVNIGVISNGDGLYLYEGAVEIASLVRDGTRASALNMRRGGNVIIRLDTGTSDISYINSAGEFGFGTNNPLSKVHIVGSSDIVQTIFQAHSTQNQNLVEFQDSDGNVDSKINADRGAAFGAFDDGNYTELEADGTLKMVGDATVFEDLQFPISNAKVPAANAPTWETFTPNTNEYGFAVDDFIDTQANEALHSWKLGSTGDVHLHITTKAANSTGADRFAKFTVVVAYCDTSETWQETSFTAELTIPDGTGALEMFYLDMGDLTLTNYVLEAEVRCRVTRIDATGGTEYSGNIFITQVGIHLENDTVGSRAENSK